MKTIAEMKAAVAAVQPTPAVDTPKTNTPFRAAAVNIIGSTVPAVKHGLVVTADATGEFLSDIAAVHKYKTLVYEGKIDPNAVAVKAEKQNVRARAR